MSGRRLSYSGVPAIIDRPSAVLIRQGNTSAGTPIPRPGMIAEKPSRRATIRQHDVTRALRAARSAGLVVFGYEIDPFTGKITVNTGTPTEKNDPDADLNWWLQKHGRKIYREK